MCLHPYRLFFLFSISLYLALTLLTSCSSSQNDSGNSTNIDLPKFNNVLGNVGLTRVGGLGQTDAWGDFNNDNFQDLILLNALSRSNNVSLNRNDTIGTFTNVTEGSGIISHRSRSVAWADFNNDNLLDLVIGTIRTLEPPILYQNLGDGVFIDVSLDAGITKEGGIIGHTIWSDYDRDGWVDLLQASRANSVRSFLYHNNGDGTFDEVSEESGLGKFNTNSAVWFDFNNNGSPDLFLANSGLNKLYLNNGDGAFTDITDSAGVGGDPDWNSVAACVGDYNGDGFFDLYVVNIFSKTTVKNALYRNNGNGTFTDVTAETGTGDVGDGRTCAWVDFDGDGWIDLFTTNHVNPSKLFRNLSNGSFLNVASQVGLDTPINVFGAAWGDYNNDGFMDVFLNGHIGVGLMENSRTRNNFIILNLIGNGETTNISAIGARVEVITSSGIKIREVSGGRGCCEQDMLPVHFGVGNEIEVDIQVRWTNEDEEVCTFSNVDVEGGRLFQVSQNGCSISGF